MKLIVKKGRTSFLTKIFLLDNTSVTGAGKTGLVNTDVTCYRCRDDDGNAAATILTLSGGTRGTWSSGGFKEKDATNMPGVYELGLDDAGLVTGSETVVYMVKGSAIVPCLLEIQLVAYDPQDGVHLGLTAIPNVASGSAGAIIVSGTGTAALSVSSGKATIDGTSALTESYSANGAAVTLAQALYEMLSIVGERVFVSTTGTCKKRDHTTTAITQTIDSATAPLSITRAT